jgi:ech hydrogenase subunit D
MREEIVPVEADRLVGEAARLKVQGYRLVTLTCTELDETTVDILYHFDKDLGLKHLRLTAAKHAPVPSISPVYFAALLVENEIQDFFGLRFEGLVVDYQGMLYLEEEALKTPYCRISLRKAAPAAGQAETAGNATVLLPDPQDAAMPPDPGRKHAREAETT